MICILDNPEKGSQLDHQREAYTADPREGPSCLMTHSNRGLGSVIATTSWVKHPPLVVADLMTELPHQSPIVVGRIRPRSPDARQSGLILMGLAKRPLRISIQAVNDLDVGRLIEDSGGVEGDGWS